MTAQRVEYFNVFVCVFFANQKLIYVIRSSEYNGRHCPFFALFFLLETFFLTIECEQIRSEFSMIRIQNSEKT